VVGATVIEPVTSLPFPYTPNALKLACNRLKNKGNIKDLHFHDFRHEAVSRLFEKGLSVPEVALISGHKDIRMLFRYTHLKAEDIVKKL
jgi:integrase